MNLTDEQKKELFEYLDKKIWETISEEWYKEYDMSKVNQKTPCLNANYANGCIHAMFEIADDLLGVDELSTLHTKYQHYVDSFLSKTDEIYRI